MKAKLILLAFTSIVIVSCRTTIEDYTVKKGPFKQSFTETGELEAVSAAALTVPRIRGEFGWDMKILYLADQGEMIKEGDTVIRIDPSSIQKFIISKEEAVESEKAAEKKQIVQMENNIQELKAQLRSEQATYDLKKLEVERGKFESENKRKIKELEFRQSTIRLDKVKRLLEKKPVLDGYDYKIQKIKIIQGESELANAREMLNKLVIISPQAGLFQLGQNRYQWPPKDLKVGDRISSGNLIARLPDIFHMKVRTSVSETDISKITLGMKVLVRLDALPEVPFHGVISEIGGACLESEQGKIFKVVVMIEESDLRLKPGMTVSCEYICFETDQAVFVPNNCILKEEGKSYVFLKKGGSPQKSEVTTGQSNGNHTIVTGSVEPGQPLVPFEEVLKKKKI
jgi:HlyD family secretion protein